MRSLILAATFVVCVPMTASAQFFPGWGWWTNPGGEVGEVPDPMDFSVMTNPMISNFLTTGPALGDDPTDVDGDVSQSNFHPISGVTGDDETEHPVVIQNPYVRPSRRTHARMHARSKPPTKSTTKSTKSAKPNTEAIAPKPEPTDAPR